MAQRMPLDSAALQAALLPWLRPPPHGVRGERTAAVREEAQLILSILQHVEVMASHDEIVRTFSRTPCEQHLAEALLLGGAAGELDRPRMLTALRAAAAEGSAWAPLWLGDMEGPRCGAAEGEGERRPEGMEARQRGWYIQAAERGHPEAPRRLAGGGAAAPRLAAPAAGMASAFAAGGGLEVSGSSEAIYATDGMAAEEEEEQEELDGEEDGAEEATAADSAADGLGLWGGELRRRLAEVAQATSDDVREEDSFRMFMPEPLRSRL